jgi:nucleoside-diphosphate-sugar epimerase
VRILLTGANGFVGKHLFESLSRNLNITVCSYTSKEKSDLWLKPISSEKFDIVIHAASKTFVPDSWINPQEFYNSNTFGTNNVLEYCRIHKAKLIFFSTVVYAQPFKNPLKESHELGALSPYAHSKLLAENLCDFYKKNFGVETAVLRPFNLFGPGQREDFIIPKIIKQALDPKLDKIELQNLKPKRDYVYIDDLVKLVEKIVENHVSGVFNVASGKSYSVNEIVDYVFKIIKQSKPIIETGPIRENDPLDVFADITHAKNIFGWMPRYTIIDGLSETVKSIKLAKA